MVCLVQRAADIEAGDNESELERLYGKAVRYGETIQVYRCAMDIATHCVCVSTKLEENKFICSYLYRLTRAYPKVNCYAASNWFSCN